MQHSLGGQVTGRDTLIRKSKTVDSSVETRPEKRGDPISGSFEITIDLEGNEGELSESPN